ncbi:MAG: hypothetical protein WCC60_16670 [Ilumatobacteraceae bacterium]
MTDPVTVPVKVQETQVPRFTARFVAVFAFLAVAAVGAMFWVLAAATNVFDSTVTYAGADGKQVVESTFDMATAKFAVATLLAFGALTVLAGVVVEFADMKVTVRTADAQAEVPVVADVALESITAGGVAAVGVAIGEIFKSLGSAMKGLRASAALLLAGTGMMITAGLVAWNTIPGTDRSPTIEVTSTSSTTTTTTTSTAPGTTTPETIAPETTTAGTTAPDTTAPETTAFGTTTTLP